MFDKNTTILKTSGEAMTLSNENVQKCIDRFREEKQKVQELSIKPMYLTYGVKLIDAPSIVRSGGSA